MRNHIKESSKSALLTLCEGNSPGTGEFPAQRASNAEKSFHLRTSSWTTCIATNEDKVDITTPVNFQSNISRSQRSCRCRVNTFNSDNLLYLAKLVIIYIKFYTCNKQILPNVHPLLLKTEIVMIQTLSSLSPAQPAVPNWHHDNSQFSTLTHTAVVKITEVVWTLIQYILYDTLKTVMMPTLSSQAAPHVVMTTCDTTVTTRLATWLLGFSWTSRIDGSVQDFSNSIANALQLLQSCTMPSI